MADEYAVKFLKDGRVRLPIPKGQPIVLRSPVVGEFKKLRQGLWDMQDAIDDLAQAERGRAEEAKEAAEAGDGERSPDAQRLDRQRDRATTEALENLYLDYAGAIVDMLGDRRLPEDREEWPLLMGGIEFINRLNQHWLTFPLAPGDQ